MPNELAGDARIPAKPKIFAAMLSILASLDSIPKDRTASESGGRGYKYRGVDDALSALNPLFAQHGVFMLPMVEGMERWTSTYKSGAAAYGVSLRVRYRFTAEDGSFVDAIVQGDGIDSGDKGVYKALSGALKYAIFQTFCIPTDEKKDPETEAHDLVGSAPKPRAAAPARAPAPAPAAAPREPGMTRTPTPPTGIVWPFKLTLKDGKERAPKTVDLAYVPTNKLKWYLDEYEPSKRGTEWAGQNAALAESVRRVLSARSAAAPAPAPAPAAPEPADEPPPADTTDHGAGADFPDDDIPF